MFNVKFCSFFEDGTTATTGISCPHYQLYKRSDGTFTVTTYKTMTDVDGVERHIASEELAADEKTNLKGRSYCHSCYIENSAGKTVECIRFDPIFAPVTN